MWASALSDFFYAGVFFFAPIDLYDSNPWSTAILHTLAWTFQEIVIEGVAFLLMQYGCGNEAAKRAGFYSFLWVILFLLIYLSYKFKYIGNYYFSCHTLFFKIWEFNWCWNCWFSLSCSYLNILYCSLGYTRRKTI